MNTPAFSSPGVDSSTSRIASRYVPSGTAATHSRTAVGGGVRVDERLEDVGHREPGGDDERSGHAARRGADRSDVGRRHVDRAGGVAVEDLEAELAGPVAVVVVDVVRRDLQPGRPHLVFDPLAELVVGRVAGQARAEVDHPLHVGADLLRRRQRDDRSHHPILVDRAPAGMTARRVVSMNAADGRHEAAGVGGVREVPGAAKSAELAARDGLVCGVGMVDGDDAVIGAPHDERRRAGEQVESVVGVDALAAVVDDVADAVDERAHGQRVRRAGRSRWRSGRG